jgi:hypothetical protein
MATNNATRQVFTSQSFITFTTPEEMRSARTRSTVTKHTARFRRSRRAKFVHFQPENIVQSFHRWRVNAAPALRDRLHQSRNSQDEVTQYQQMMVEIGRVSNSLPISLEARPSLQQCKYIDCRKPSL